MYGNLLDTTVFVSMFARGSVSQTFRRCLKRGTETETKEREREILQGLKFIVLYIIQID